MTDKDSLSPDDAHDTGRARIAKVMARAGLASRRDAETWIAAGRVAVNGTIVQSPALNVGPDDHITVDGKPLPTRERTRLWLYHKPRGLVTTSKDPEGRTTVFEVLPPELPRVVSVGKLDLNTEGLLLLTNDGGLARVLAHPSTAWLRRYRVRVFGKVDLARLQALREGIEIDGFSYGPIEAELDRQQGDNAWLTLGLREGKNREVRKVLEHLGLSVNRLIRISFGPFQLGDLGEGAAEEIRTRYLRDQLGGLAEEANCDFEAPIVDRTPEPVKKVLRSRAENADAPRRRAGLTTDRKGRRVLVERVEKDKPKEQKPRGDRDDRHTGRPDANRPRGDRSNFAGGLERGERQPRREGAQTRPFRARDDARARPDPEPRRGPPRDAAKRAPRRDGEAPRPFRARDDKPDRPPRRDGNAPRPERSGRFGHSERDGSRPLRAPSDRPREERTERPQEPRPNGNRTRVFRPRPAGEPRPERENRRGPARSSAPGDARERDQRPPRRDGEGRSPRRPDGERPPRRDGDKPRSFGGKPGGPGARGAQSHAPDTRSGAPQGRPGGGKPGGRPPSGKPGGRPTGGRPGGGKPRSRG